MTQSVDGGQRIAMWSGPRSLSTAMLRSWENRRDTTVSDEPFYGYYLRTTGADRPGREHSLATMPTEWRTVVRDLEGPIPNDRAIWFQKHHALHILPDVSREWIPMAANFFLIRNPRHVVASYARIRPIFTAGDLGYDAMVDIFRWIGDRTDQEPLVVDASDVLADPEGQLRALCRALGVDFQMSMLSWPAGRRTTDPEPGDPWYAHVQRTTGFGRPTEAPRALPDQYLEIVKACERSYRFLHERRLRLT
ncbi:MULTISPECIES: sulfotransferase family protein [unclassified Streptomyces]|uniref:sulfotransferase-like domain-containing protein n=1 Tax=unclassified Streptomyces TaxID=2593676 RepID=UPI00069C78AE|nr:sulfotransferase family protein [Streptomyces sp. CNQ-509]